MSNIPNIPPPALPAPAIPNIPQRRQLPPEYNNFHSCGRRFIDCTCAACLQCGMDPMDCKCPPMPLPIGTSSAVPVNAFLPQPPVRSYAVNPYSADPVARSRGGIPVDSSLVPIGTSAGTPFPIGIVAARPPSKCCGMTFGCTCVKCLRCGGLPYECKCKRT